MYKGRVEEAASKSLARRGDITDELVHPTDLSPEGGFRPWTCACLEEERKVRTDGAGGGGVESEMMRAGCPLVASVRATRAESGERRGG